MYGLRLFYRAQSDLSSEEKERERESKRARDGKQARIYFNCQNIEGSAYDFIVDGRLVPQTGYLSFIAPSPPPSSVVPGHPWTS